jgi:hypothetical protein
MSEPAPEKTVSVECSLVDIVTFVPQYYEALDRYGGKHVGSITTMDIFTKGERQYIAKFDDERNAHSFELEMRQLQLTVRSSS